MSVKRHTLYNIAGALIPTLLAVATIPLNLHTMGPQRFGALSAIWIICGSVGFLDLGLNRALSYSVAKAAAEEPDRRHRLVATALVIGGLSAPAAAILTYFGAHWYFTSSFLAGQAVIHDVERALPLVAVTSVTTVLLGVITGALQGNRSFLQANLFLTGMAASLQLGPIVYLVPGMQSMTSIMAAVVLLRVLTLAFGLVSIARELGFQALVEFRRAEIRPLLSFSKWTMGIAFIGPFVLYCDKILIGSLVGGAALAFYNIPFQLAQRVTIISIAVGSAIFPDLVNSDTDRRSELTSRAISYVYMIVTLPCFLIILLFSRFLEIWLGIFPGLDLRLTCGLLVLSFWINCFGQIYHYSLVTMNKPNVVFYILTAEFFSYPLAQYYSVGLFGISGAAGTFLILCIIDSILMFRFSRLKNSAIMPILSDIIVLSSGIFVSVYRSPSIFFALSTAVIGSTLIIVVRFQLLAAAITHFINLRRRD